MALNILRSPRQFRRVYRDGKKVDCKYAIVFYYRAEEPVDGPLFGFVASKRLGGAVRRNRARRLLRTAARTLADRFIDRELWVVLVARSGILQIKCQDLLQELQGKLSAEGLLSSEPSR